MLNISDLLIAIDAYRVVAGGIPETTASYRIFGDSKKLNALREGGDLTTARFNATICWLSEGWPADCEIPRFIQEFQRQVFANSSPDEQSEEVA